MPDLVNSHCDSGDINIVDTRLLWLWGNFLDYCVENVRTHRCYQQKRKVKMITTHNTNVDEKNTASIFDPSHLLNELGEEWELLEEILGIFQKSTTFDLESLREAITSGNSDQTIRRAHKIKGAAANINAEGVRKAASDIEMAAKAGSTRETNALLENLFQEFDTLTQLLRDSDWKSPCQKEK